MTPASTTRFESGRIVSRNTHGTGCTLASGIACGLAQGLGLERSVARARDYLIEAIRRAPPHPRRRPRPGGPRLADAPGRPVAPAGRERPGPRARVDRRGAARGDACAPRCASWRCWSARATWGCQTRCCFPAQVYQTAWNALTGRDPDHGIKDYDLGLHDPDTSWEAEDVWIRRVARRPACAPRSTPPSRCATRPACTSGSTRGSAATSPIRRCAPRPRPLERFVCPAFGVGARLGAGGKVEIVAPLRPRRPVRPAPDAPTLAAR